MSKDLAGSRRILLDLGATPTHFTLIPQEILYARERELREDFLRKKCVSV